MSTFRPSPSDRYHQYNNRLKYDGVKLSRKNLGQLKDRFIDENHKALDEANLEQDVLRMKSYATRRGWVFPPETSSRKWMADKINKYYGKEVTKFVPKEK